jgi:hypothetical protein
MWYSLSVTCERSVVFSGPPVPSTNKTYPHDITEILLKLALNTIKQTNKNYKVTSLNGHYRFHYKMLKYSQRTQVFVTLDFTLYISYKTTFSIFFYCDVISKRILIIFASEEAEIFKDYLFILAWFSVRLPLFSYDLKTIFCFLTSLLYILTKIKSEKSTFAFKSPENKNHADKNYYQINK